MPRRPSPLPWPAPWRLPIVGLLLGSATALAQEAPPETTDEAERFGLQIEAPAPIATLLRRHLELQRFSTLPDLSRGELERLAAQTPDNVRALLATQGHFAPEVSVSVSPPLGPDDSAPPHPMVKVRVEPGPLTRVTSVVLQLQGDARDRPEAAAQRQALQTDWALPAGQPFSQAGWEQAKTRALRGLTAYRYPRAQIDTSLADIDPVAHAAHLYLDIDSGPAYTLGPLRVQGAMRYDAVMAERLARLAGVRPGLPYDETLLQAAQQRLVDSGYYASALVVLAEAQDPAAAPVDIQIREVPLQKVTAGVGVSSDNGPRLSLEHTHHRLPRLDWRAVSRLQLEGQASTLSSEWRSPVDEQGWHWLGAAQLQRQRDEPLITHSQQARAGLAQDGIDLDRSLFVQYDRARVENPVLNLPGEAESSVSLNHGWTRRHFNDRVAPTAGQGLSVEVGLGVTLNQQHRAYLRTRARWQAYRPWGDGSARQGRWALRLEGGAIWSQDSSPVPATQRFLAGGDNSVRGYRLREIGVPLPGGGVEAGRWLAISSLEWQRPLRIDGQPSPWEAALFIDAGAVAHRARDLEAKVGVGGGVRYRSPVGPLQADLAYGVDPRRWRLHLSVGFTF